MLILLMLLDVLVKFSDSGCCTSACTACRVAWLLYKAAAVLCKTFAVPQSVLHFVPCCCSPPVGAIYIWLVELLALAVWKKWLQLSVGFCCTGATELNAVGKLFYPSHTTAFTTSAILLVILPVRWNCSSLVPGEKWTYWS